MAPGVSSTISSTPVACSRARMFRPSRPMMRPLRSSLGRSTTETVVSMVCSGALRWMAWVMICLAFSAACSRASASSRLTRLAASRRASCSICLMTSSFASSAVRPETRCRACCCSRTSSSQRRRSSARVSSRSSSSCCPFREIRLVALGLAVLLGQLLGPAGELSLDRLQLVAPLLALTLALLHQRVGLLLDRELRLLPVGVGLPAGVVQEAVRLLSRPTDGAGGAFAGQEPGETHDADGQDDACGRDKVHGWSLGPRGGCRRGSRGAPDGRRAGSPSTGGAGAAARYVWCRTAGRRHLER